MSLFDHQPHPHTEARKDAGPVKTTDQQVGFNGRLAAWMTTKVGTMQAFYTIAAWQFGWMALAQMHVLTFDPYPFAFLLFLGNIIQLLLMFVILVGQQVLGRAADKRALQTYQDAEAILHEAVELQRHLAAQDAALQAQDAVLASLIDHVKGAPAPATEGTPS